MSVHGGGLCGPDEPLQLGAAVVLCLCGQLFDVNISSQQVKAPHLNGVDVQDLDATLLIRKTWRTCAVAMREN